MSYASLTGTRPAGVFDDLYVRSPPKIGPYVQVLSSGVGGGIDLDGKRDVVDSYSRTETVSLITSSTYTQAESDALFQTETAAATALSLKRDVTDSLSTNEVNALLGAKVDETTYQGGISLKRDKEGSLSSAQTAVIYQTKADTTNALALKRDTATSLSAVEVAAGLAQKRNVADSLTTGEVNTLLGSKVDDTTYQSALSLKRDKEGSLSSVQTANLYPTKVDTTASLALKRDVATSLSAVEVAAGLAQKRNISDSMSSTDIQALAAQERPISSITGLQGELDNRAGQSATTVALSLKQDKGNAYTSNEVDTLLDEKHPRILNNGSLDIAVIGGLNAILGSFQPIITSGNLSIAMTSGLQLALNTLATNIAAILPSQVILSNGTFVNQHRFGIENGEVVLDLDLGWLFRARPLWSQLRVDPMRLRHARAGTLPLDPPADCLLYMPCISSTKDLGPGNLHLLHLIDDSQVYGVYAHIPPSSMSDGYTLTTPHKYLLPGRNVPITPLTSTGAGWASTLNASWLLEFQLYMPTDSFFQVLATSDADVSYAAPDRLLFLSVDAGAGTLAVRWDERTGSGDSGAVTNSVEVSLPVRWHTFAFQKSAGSNRVYAFHNGLLVLSEDITSPLSHLDHFRLSSLNSPILREFSVRTSCVLPEIPFTSASPVQYNIGDPHLRWNSYMM